MGWGTQFKADIYINKQVFKSTYELDDKIEELSSTLNMYKALLKQYASATPRDIVPKEWEGEPIEWLNNKVDEIVDSFEELQYDLYRLRLFKDHLEETNTPIEEFNPYKDGL